MQDCYPHQEWQQQQQLIEVGSHFSTTLATLSIILFDYLIIICSLLQFLLVYRMHFTEKSHPINQHQHHQQQQLLQSPRSQLHGHIVPNQQSLEESITLFNRKPNVFAASKLISEVCKQKNDLDLAFRIYQTLISSRMKPDLVVIRTLINGCRILEQPRRALSLIDEMERYSIEPDKICFGWLTMACSQTGDVKMASKLINKMTRGQMKFEVNVIDCTQLIQAMTKNSNERRYLEVAMEIVKFMDQHNIELDNTAYSCLLTACSNVGAIEIGKQLHQRMIIEKRIKPSITLNTALITMYGKCGNLDEAITIFNSIPKEEMNVITLNSMIAVYGQHGQLNEAMKLFEEMQQPHQPWSIEPNEVTWITMISACSNVGAIEIGKQLHQRMIIEKRINVITFISSLGIELNIVIASERFPHLPYIVINAVFNVIDGLIRFSLIIR